MLELPICESLTHNAPHKHKSRYSEQTKSLQTLHSFLLGVIADNILTESEIFALKKWLDDNSDLSGQYPFDKVFSVIEKALDDNMLDQNELDKMLSLFKKYTTPSENCTSLSPSIVIQNKLFCLTGDFIHGERKEIECLIESMGGICKNGVSGKVNYVIVGSNGSPDWSCGNYGNKIKRALELQEQGKDIQIVKEADFFAVLE